MTVPLWTPFALLALVCAVCPRPAWTYRVDWRAVSLVVSLVAFWASIGVWLSTAS